MTQDLKEIIIKKEDAVFWMDGNGRWHNEHGPFEHKKVVAYFNRSIRHDADGYFVSQVRDDMLEKVYFPFQETALFAVDVTTHDDISLRLNTGRQMLLDPDNLMIRGDSLFMRIESQLIKFTDRSMMKLSDLLEDIDGRFTILVKGVRYPIPEQ
jgi:hypothetical protein